MHKFNRNDRVKIMRGKYKDKIAVVSQVEEHEDDDGYNYIVKGADDPFCLLIDEEFIESAPIVTGKNIFLDHLNESANNEEKPRFRVGDVVIVVNDVLHQYTDGIVQEVVAVDNGKSRHYEYHIAEFDRPLSGWDAYEESAVVFKYHDAQWEEYYTEMMNQHRKCVEQRELMEHVEQEPKLIKSFKKGNKVKAKSRFASGVGIIEHVTGEGEWAEYMITLQGENEPRIFYEKNLELIPLFDVGDVVNVEDDPNRVYVVNESILVGDEKNARYMYEVSSVYGDEDDIITCEESSLTFQYHDLSYEEYFTEGTRIKNDLPPWRGELYNLYAVCTNPDDLTDKNSLYKDYINDTLPVDRMIHIIHRHSVYTRINDVIVNRGNTRRNQNRREMIKNLKLDSDDELSELSASVKKKIISMNTTDVDSEHNGKIKKYHIPEFTREELLFVSELDRLDISDRKIKDHYPVKMTNLQIMGAIKEAYENAYKMGEMVIQYHDDPNGESLAAPIKGKRLYRGVLSRNNDLKIEFWYNFDRDFIETAYPLRMNNNAERHVRDRLDRK